MIFIRWVCFFFHFFNFNNRNFSNHTSQVGQQKAYKAMHAFCYVIIIGSLSLACLRSCWLSWSWCCTSPTLPAQLLKASGARAETLIYVFSCFKLHFQQDLFTNGDRRLEQSTDRSLGFDLFIALAGPLRWWIRCRPRPPALNMQILFSLNPVRNIHFAMISDHLPNQPPGRNICNDFNWNCATIIEQNCYDLFR